MKWTNAKRLSTSQFQRRFGVNRITFDKMVEIVKSDTPEHLQKRKKGRPPSLIIEDGLLLLLGYYREYRTLYHLSGDYGVSEATACRTVKKYEKILIRAKEFHLPGKRQLYKTATSFEMVVIDATESPIERPKKTKVVLFRQKEKTFLKNATCN